MSINTYSETLLRRAADEAEDTKQYADNVRAYRWKEWPNDAAFVGLDEHRGPLPLTVKGSIPNWAAGELYRTGPGISEFETDTGRMHYVSHWFDGFAHTHRFEIVPSGTPGGSATVTYSSRRQSDKLVAAIKKKGWRTSTTFGQRADPCVGIFAKAMSVFEPKPEPDFNVTIMTDPYGKSDQQANGAAQGHRTGVKKMYIGSDIAQFREIDPKTLEPLGISSEKKLHPKLTGVLSPAHGERDPDNGDWFNVNQEFGASAKYRIFRVNQATRDTDIIGTVADSSVKPAYIHSFFMTENYVVLCIPTTHIGLAGLAIPLHNNMVEALVPFDKKTDMQWAVIDRRNNKGVVARFSTPAGFFFHSSNSFEEKTVDEQGRERTDIFVEAVQYDTTDVILGFYYDVMLDRNDATAKHWLSGDRVTSSLPRLVRHRYRLPLDGEQPGKTAEEVVSIPGPHVGELPTINPSYKCRRHRYVYTTSSRGLSALLDCLTKTDADTGDTLVWTPPHGHLPGEPIFVPRPASAREGDGPLAEDDGVILSVVLDGPARNSYLLCLDARTMEEVGRAEANFAIGMGFHGAHFPYSDEPLQQRL